MVNRPDNVNHLDVELEHNAGVRTVRVPYCSARDLGGEMVKVSVLYPKQSDTTFDISYYVNSHIKMVQQLLGTQLKGVAVEEGISGIQPGSSPSYAAMGHLLFESVADFQASFGLHAQTIVEDIPNYTNSQPIIQISEVKL